MNQCPTCGKPLKPADQDECKRCDKVDATEADNAPVDVVLQRQARRYGRR